jgi:hypothetical protein
MDKRFNLASDDGDEPYWCSFDVGEMSRLNLIRLYGPEDEDVT